MAKPFFENYFRHLFHKVSDMSAPENGSKLVSWTKDKDEDAQIDIVFIPKPSDNCWKGWVAEGDGAVWPKDRLEEDIETARILGFGYDAQVSGKSFEGHARDLQASLSDLRRVTNTEKRPIILIARGLGGIVSAKMAGADELSKHVCGMVFFGTPFRSTGTRSFATVVQDVLKAEDGANEGSLVQEACGIRETFRNSLKNGAAGIQTVAFYEKIPTIGGKKLVDEHVVRPSEHTILAGLNKDHHGIGRFEAEDTEYDIVVKELKNLVASVVQEKAPPNNPTFYVHEGNLVNGRNEGGAHSRNHGTINYNAAKQ